MDYTSQPKRWPLSAAVTLIGTAAAVLWAAVGFSAYALLHLMAH